MNTFPEKPTSNYSIDDLTSYLLEIQGMGYDVYKNPSSENRFEIILNETFSLSCSFGNGKTQVQLYRFGNILNLSNVSSKIQLQRVIAEFIKSALGAFPSPPQSARLYENKPSTNYQNISNLIGGSEIMAVFDPYLENSALETLINICSFGKGKITKNIRLLGSNKKAKGPKPTFTNAGVSAFLQQSNVTGSAKVMSSNSEHRRFILLSGGTSLLLGPSLNSIHKNEAIRIEPDIEDLKFFNETWNKAIPL